MEEKTIADEMIEMLATLRTDLAHVRGKSDAIDNKVNLINDRGIRNEAAAQSAHKRIDGMEPRLANIERLHPTVERIAPMVDNHQAILNQGKGAKAVVGWVWGVTCSVVAFIVGALITFLSGLFQ